MNSCRANSFCETTELRRSTTSIILAQDSSDSLNDYHQSRAGCSIQRANFESYSRQWTWFVAMGVEKALSSSQVGFVSFKFLELLHVTSGEDEELFCPQSIFFNTTEKLTINPILSLNYKPKLSRKVSCTLRCVCPALAFFCLHKFKFVNKFYKNDLGIELREYNCKYHLAAFSFIHL